MTQLIFERKITKLEARRDKKGGGEKKSSSELNRCPYMYTCLTIEKRMSGRF